MAAKLTGIGVGPGEPELLTLKALQALREAEAIFVPGSGERQESLALMAVQRYLHAGQEVVSLHLPMTRDREELAMAWREASMTMAKKLGCVRRAVFLTLGDPLLYSTWGYLNRELRKLCPDMEIEVIPGISSAAAAAAAFGLPLAEGKEGLGILPLPEKLEQLEQALALFPNLVLLKIGRRYGELYTYLSRRGLIERSGLAIRLGLQGERLAMPLPPPETVPDDYFSLVLVKGA